MKVIIISAGNVLHLIILIVSLVISYPFCVFGQDSASIVGQKQRDWSLSFHLGGSVGGPAKEIEEAMRMAGLDYGSVTPFFSERNRLIARLGNSEAGDASRTRSINSFNELIREAAGSSQSVSSSPRSPTPAWCI